MAAMAWHDIRRRSHRLVLKGDEARVDFRYILLNSRHQPAEWYQPVIGVSSGSRRFKVSILRRRHQCDRDRRQRRG